MTTEYTPVPWEAQNLGKVFDGKNWQVVPKVRPKTGDKVTNAFCLKIAGDIPDEADARRIVACVNACEGISTEDLEQGMVKYLLATNELESEKKNKKPFAFSHTGSKS